MISRKEAHLTNWTDGMKVSKDHFIQSENALIEHSRDLISSQLGPFGYGVLPIVDNEESLVMEDAEVGDVGIKITISTCRAITPDGSRIEIYKGLYQNEELPTATKFTKDTSRDDKIYHVILTCTDYWIENGEIDINENPPRRPSRLPQYELLFVDKGSKSIPRNALIVGRLERIGETFKLNRSYCAPSTCIASQGKLLGWFEEYVKRVKLLHEYGIAIRKKFHQNPYDNIRKNLFVLNESVLYFLSTSIDQLEDEYQYKNPKATFNHFRSLIRIFFTHFQTWELNEANEISNYLKGNANITFAQTLDTFRKVIDTSYDHNAISTVFKAIDSGGATLQQIYEVIADTRENSGPSESKIHGWLVYHMVKRDVVAYPLTELVTTIGQSELQSPNHIHFDHDLTMNLKHAEIKVSQVSNPNTFIIKDLSTKNGSYDLRDRDRIEGGQELTFRDGDYVQFGYSVFCLLLGEGLTKKGVEEKVARSENPKPVRFIAKQ